MATTTKIFKLGGGQAVRIPEEHRLEVSTVTLHRAGAGLLILPALRTAARRRRPGFPKGLKIAGDFDAPLRPRVLKAFGKA